LFSALEVYALGWPVFRSEFAHRPVIASAMRCTAAGSFVFRIPIPDSDLSSRSDCPDYGISAVLRLVHTMGWTRSNLGQSRGGTRTHVCRGIHTVRSGIGQGTDSRCTSTRMSDTSDVEVFILAAVCEEVMKKRKKKDNRMWMSNYQGVTRVNFIQLFQRLCKDPVKHKTSCLRIWRPRCDFGFIGNGDRVRTRLVHGRKVASLSGPRCPALDLTGT
jgi:hypothetical protein